MLENNVTISVRTRKDRQEIKALARERFREQRGTAILLGFLYALMAGVSGALDSIAQQLGGPVAYWIVYTIGALFLWVMMIHMYGGYAHVYESKRTSPGVLFSGFAVGFWRKLGGYLWMSLFLILWALPGSALMGIGIVFMLTNEILGEFIMVGGLAVMFVLLTLKGLSYEFTTYILATCPNVKATDALRLSIRMTTGYRGDLLIMSLSFFGWTMLVLLPLLLLMVPGFILLAFSSYGLGILLIVLGGIGAILISVLFVGPYYSLAKAGNFVELRDRAIRTGEITLEELGIAIEEPPTETLEAIPTEGSAPTENTTTEASISTEIPTELEAPAEAPVPTTETPAEESVSTESHSEEPAPTEETPVEEPDTSEDEEA